MLSNVCSLCPLSLSLSQYRKPLGHFIGHSQRQIKLPQSLSLGTWLGQRWGSEVNNFFFTFSCKTGFTHQPASQPYHHQNQGTAARHLLVRWKMKNSSLEFCYIFNNMQCFYESHIFFISIINMQTTKEVCQLEHLVNHLCNSRWKSLNSLKFLLLNFCHSNWKLFALKFLQCFPQSKQF